MSEEIYSKDYGEYFSQLEKELEQKESLAPERNEEPTDVISSEKPQTISKKRLALVSVAMLLIIAVIIGIAVGAGGKTATAEKKKDDVIEDTSEREKKTDLYAKVTSDTAAVAGDINSKNVIVIDCAENEIIASRDAEARVSPASTTKVMTLLVATENISDMNDTFTMTYEITDPLFEAEATVAGFSAGEEIGMTDLLYGVILPSGGDASIALAQKISGSEEAFAALMNEKAEQLGLKNTHFVNCTGLYHPDHYTSVADMAVILKAAMENSLCRSILSTYQYTTASTPQHPDGLMLTSTLFSYMYGTEPETAEILGGKTGFVNESGYCIASFGVGNSGKEYICVAFGGDSKWPAVYDQINIYSKYAK